jgi:hypothetical protein
MLELKVNRKVGATLTGLLMCFTLYGCVAENESPSKLSNTTAISLGKLTYNGLEVKIPIIVNEDFAFGIDSALYVCRTISQLNKQEIYFSVYKCLVSNNSVIYSPEIVISKITPGNYKVFYKGPEKSIFIDDITII